MADEQARHLTKHPQHERLVEHYHRNDDGTWTLRDARPGDVIDVAAIGVRLSVDDIYFDPAAEA